ncbi:MAG: RNA 2',3'-cyclic phosphodiesterase [Candidatus Diapherotrites archaeon]|nr:RNA 2',3'-cyclic phosphodiesterase [Candidatus Diapherotrites archaeon]
MPESVRLFLAINLDDAINKEIDTKFLFAIPADGFSKTKPQNLHLTLQFLGEKDPSDAKQLFERLQGLESFESFDLELGSVGQFDSRVLWIGTKKGSDDLRLLAKKISAAIGIPNPDFHGHVTLGRNAGCEAKEFGERVERLRQVSFARTVRVCGFDLMRSTLTSNGPLYKKVFSIVFEQRRMGRLFLRSLTTERSNARSRTWARQR